MADYEDSRSGRAGFLHVTTKTTLPSPVTLTGTITSVGKDVTGVGTLFLSELTKAQGQFNAYGYIYDSGSGEIRQIDVVKDDTHLTLKTAFTVDVAAIAIVCPDFKYSYREVDIWVAGAFGKIAGVDQIVVTMLANSWIKNRNDGGLEPIALDGTVSPLQVTTLL